MACTRVGGCLKERTKNWAHPQECVCEIREQLARHYKERENAIGKKVHLSDLARVYQHRSQA